MGGAHCVVVTGSDHAFAWGANESGQLGVGDASRRTTSERIRSLCQLRVFRVACGRNHTLALTDGGVYAFGSNSNGQLGLASSDAHRSTRVPQLVAALGTSNIADVACGGAVSAAITVRGELLTWGASAYGLLGNDNSPGGSNSEDARMPTVVAALARERTLQVLRRFDWLFFE